MKRSRSFRPSAPLGLEDRVVPSTVSAPHISASALAQVAALAARGGVKVQRVGSSAAEIAQSNASGVPFGIDTSDSLRAGYSVAEQRTTTYSLSIPQTATWLEVPNLANNSVTTYKTINLRNNGGTETVVDTETFSGGAIPLSGTHNTHTITTTLPNGGVQTEIDNEVITGHKTVINATLHEANGGIEIWTSVNVRHGPTTVANRTITEPGGTIEHVKTVTTHRGELDSTAHTRTVLPGEIQVGASATNVIRVQPPSA
jgi:hypothetical protein